MEQILNEMSRLKYNYIAVAITNWHLIGARAACEYLKHKGLEVNPLYLIMKHPEQGYLQLDTSNLNYRRLDIDANFNGKRLMSLLVRIYLYDTKRETELYIGMPWCISTKILAVLCKTTQFKCIIYEEGAKSYNPNYQKLSYLYKKLNTLQFANKCFALYVQKKLSMRHQIIDFLPIQNNRSGWNVNREISQYYKQVMGIHNIELDENVILIVMQSIEQEYLRVVQRIIPLLQAEGKRIFIKEHPRFPLKGYDFGKVELINDSSSLEVLMPHIKAKYIISFFSTALITTKVFFDCVSISLYDLMDKNKIREEVGDLLSWFKHSFGKIVLYPQSLEDLTTIIHSDNIFDTEN